MNIATTNAIAKIAAVVAGLGLVSMSFAFAVPAKAATVDDLQAQINALLAQIAALQGGSSSASTTFTMDLTVGSTGAEVTALQNFLISNGYAIPAGATGYFGAQTQAALAAFQAANGISPAAGYFGPSTRAKVNGMGGGSTGGSTGGDDDDFSGDEEGYLDDLERVSSYTGEEVGEGEEDVTVLAVEMEAVDADQKIERVTVEFDNPEDTSNTDELDEIIEEVSLWLDGEELDRMDVDDASYDRDGGTSSNGLYTFRFTGLDGVISEGDVGELAVAVTAQNNVDSASEGDTFDVFIPADGIRAVSPNGVDDTYDTAAHETTFSVESFASANDIELSSTVGDNNPDEGVVVIDDEGDNILLLEGELRAEGSDMLLFDLPVQLFTSGATDVDQVIDELVLEIDGEEFSENVSTSATTTTITITFDDLNIDIAEDDTITYTVTGKSATSSVDATQEVTLKASTTVASIDAEDASGENIGSADLTGTATGETQHLFSTVADIEIVSTDIDPVDNGNAAAKSAKATIEVKVTALGGTIYLNGDDATEANRFFVGIPYGSNVNIGVGSTTASSTTFTVISGENDISGSGGANEYYTLEEDESMTIRIESTVDRVADATDTVALAGLKALLFQFGTADTSATTRSAVDLDWSDLTDQTQTGTESLVQ